MSTLTKKAFQRFGPIYRDPIPRFPVGARQRSLLTDNSLSLSESEGSLPVEDTEGVNFEFNYDGDITWFYLFDEFANKYRIDIYDGLQYTITAAAGGVVSVAPPPVNNGNYIFNADNYLRFRNTNSDASFFLQVNSADGTLSVEALPGNVPASGNQASETFSSGINFVIQDNYFYFKDELGNRWLPLIVEEAANVFVVQLTAV